MKKRRTQHHTTPHSWSMSDAWVDSNILEWQRLWNDGLPHDEARMQSTDRILREGGCQDENYFVWMSIASLGLDPFDVQARKRMNIDHAARRGFALIFFAKMSKDIGEARLRKRLNVLVERGEVKS